MFACSFDHFAECCFFVFFKRGIMYQSFYLSIDPKQVQEHWCLPLLELQAEFQRCLPIEPQSNWAMPNQRMYKFALEPQFKFFKKKYGEKISLHEIAAKLSAGLVSENRNADWDPSEVAPKVYELVRIQSVYRALLLLDHIGICNYPIIHHIGDDYFLHYLKYRAGVHNFLQYDPRIRKNFIEFMSLPELKNIIPNIWDRYDIENLFSCPVHLEARVWREKWDKLNGIPDFWENFKIVDGGQNQDEIREFGISLYLAKDKKMRKNKKIHKDDLLQKYLEKAWPKYPDVESPAFLAIALPHLQAIGEIAAYAEQHQLWLVKFYI
jgi:hypothetical protein